MQNISFVIDTSAFVEALLFGVFGFAFAMLITPLYTTLAYKYKWWKRARTNAVTGEKATLYQKLHAEKHRHNIPTMAGIIFVVSTAIVTLSVNLDRTQTWLPLAAMVGAGAVGLLDDILNIKGLNKSVAGLRARTKSILIFLVSLVGGWWFYAKLGVDAIHVPAVGDVTLGWLIIPLFILVVISTANAVNISDGLDGLAGGLAAIAFSIYGLIAMLQGEYGIAGFCITVTGALLSYTWFNIHPARFFMGDSGSFALGTALGVVAMLTNTVLLLPIIGGVFVVEAGSSLIQIMSKKLRNGKKVFKIAPIHHHFEAEGWPETKVTMRFWVLGTICAFMGLILYLLEQLS
ncbi:phospho-N-acetylmuramoyl-pentapeptide-transferase [Candidatus Saccharibacteria bacterium]|nr:phospho-N-acetylmuramoyl-pentapeptide-transferase [Candidatus Saccharibacteria bacterium]